MPRKIIAIGAGFALLAFAAAGAFASQDSVLLQQELTETPTETPAVDVETSTPAGTETASPTETATEASTDTPSAPETPAGATETPVPTDTAGPSETPAATETPGDEDDDDDIQGIPDGNPRKHHEDGDGECEEGETITKTTPSGNKVEVPCQTDKHGGQQGSSFDNNDNDDDDDDGGEHGRGQGKKGWNGHW